MGNRLSQFGFNAGLAMQIALLLVVLCPQAHSQRTGVQPPKPQTQGRELQVREMRSGGALDGRGRLWAVVIGVSKYKNLAPKEQLEFAHRDAEDFAAFLRTPNGGGYPSSHLTVLTNEAATLSTIRSTLGTTLPRSVEADDMVVIFFAGHGIVEGERDGYLLAYDSDPQNLYATALQVSELNRIITERLKARNVILIADACHSGQLGWTSRGAAESTVLVNRYLDEVGKSGKGVFRLLASRVDQRSYEGKHWGGGHGCFTWFLLEGLRGRADRDKDGMVRVGELLEFITDNVPKATQALQHPRAAGDIDMQLPMAVWATPAPKVGENVSMSSRLVSLEVRGTPGMEVYLDNVFRGRVLPTGVLVVDQLAPGEHDLSIIAPNIEPIAQKLALTTAKTNLILNVRGREAVSGSPLAGRIKQAISQGKVFDAGGALQLYQQLVRESPKDPQRASVEASLTGALDAIGQQVINNYVQLAGRPIPRGMFQYGAESFRLLKAFGGAGDSRIEAKYLFCAGYTRIEEKRLQEAADLFEKAAALDSRAAYVHNALGYVHKQLGKDKQAQESFERALQLTPTWSLPQLHLGQYYFERGKWEKAEKAFRNAAQFDPRYPEARIMLLRTMLQFSKAEEIEREANETLRLFPNQPDAHFALGLVYESTKRYGQAADAFETVVRLSPNSTEREALLKRAAENRKRAKK